ncbi:MAG TPA: hypothetical protein VEB86_13435 [Chryseosolibacter sp.]|nr:hypothetical protein [Chryseosolibacter sp.]
MHKRYSAHYQIPADQALIVPRKNLGDEVSCDIRWENDNGELQMQENRVFVKLNLVALNPITDDKLYELWQHYYEGKEV